jgi:putative membrane protein
MNLAAQVLAAFVAFEHFGFMVLEAYFWNKPLGLKIFRRTQAEADSSFALAKNQGLYNGFLAAGLVWGLVAEPAIGVPVRLFFLGCVVVAGIVGAITVSPRIFVVQGAPALVGLAVTWMGR